MAIRQNCVFLGFIVVIAVTSTVHSENVSTLKKAETYLEKQDRITANEASSDALKDFHSPVGVNVTGALDEETMDLMPQSHFDNENSTGFGNGSRKKRFALLNNRHYKNDIKYFIRNYDCNLLPKVVDTEVARAFALWSEYTNLTFTQITDGPVDIEIYFVPGESIKHPLFPKYITLGITDRYNSVSRVRFNYDVTWSAGDDLYVERFFEVAAHEFGHALGIAHPPSNWCLMRPIYLSNEPYLKLDPDDVFAIQTLYGKKNEFQCRKTDAIFTLATGQTIVFKGNQYYEFPENAMISFRPAFISDRWPGLPGNIDAAYTYKNGETYFFRGAQYWRYNGFHLDGNYPKRINESFLYIPNDLDAAFVIGNIIHFYKNGSYWSSMPSKGSLTDNVMLPEKKIIREFNLPSDIDVDLQDTRGNTYYFPNDRCLRFNEGTHPVRRPSAEVVFGCRR